MNTLQFCLLVAVIQTASGFQLLNRKPATFTRHSKCGHLQVSHVSSTSCHMLMNAGSNSSSHSSQGFQSNGDENCTGCCIPAAHGLICPETIANMAKEARKNPVIQRFVETYHRYGPLACEDMLSDPDILPHLTKAMRDIA
jgi:hypothetical protein